MRATKAGVVCNLSCRHHELTSQASLRVAWGERPCAGGGVSSSNRSGFRVPASRPNTQPRVRLSRGARLIERDLSWQRRWERWKIRSGDRGRQEFKVHQRVLRLPHPYAKTHSVTKAETLIFPLRLNPPPSWGGEERAGKPGGRRNREVKTCYWRWRRSSSGWPSRCASTCRLMWRWTIWWGREPWGWLMR